MLISVIIPTKQRPLPLHDAVQSILRNTYQSFELIIVDQSLDDASATMLASCCLDPRLRYLRNRRPGVGAASSRNLGIAASNGEIVTMTDDDIEAPPNWLELIAAEFRADPELDFITGRLTAPPYDPATGYTPEFNAWTGMPRWRLPIHASGANFSMRRRLLDRIGGYDELCGPGSRLGAIDDTGLCWRVLRSGARYKICPHIEVIHTHGFRPHPAGQELLDRYQYGNGGAFGRLARQGDRFAGMWFLGREVKQIMRAILATIRGDRHALRHSQLRLRGFWNGFRLPPYEGFVSGRQLQQLRELALAAEIPLDSFSQPSRHQIVASQ
ncbi:glycosyltransferase family A protein [Chloroflexus sp.]|uniref:glycosyltransferase family 2 protein n=1 Tax=Chloroflexus sp. TaxID=1904827 RepID=UPI00298ED990|nr:glycosyltransferase family A protein [Chloroflexus sp.]MCS6887656.1 glycosyltransferase family 2 protein [Chloroflexus sp.]MCX7859757.1 glycosyltransferase family 2 protein [Chloroflexus sp.]MDW8403311.1 glycosyltransferase family A protein [Chloroflexus sp.]